MGYSYGQAPSGRWVLSCDNCGDIGGVRKRPCRFKVLGSSRGSSTGRRYAVPYCPAPAVCPPCFEKLGRTKGLHPEDRCGVGAAESQRRYDAEQAVIDSGEPMRVSAINAGSGQVRVTFQGRDGEVDYLMSEEAYDSVSLMTPATPDTYQDRGYLLSPVS